MTSTISDIRKEYIRHELGEKDVLPDPINQFHVWFNEAVKAEVDEVNAMTLATADENGIPSARIVLLKGADENGFSFFTNYRRRVKSKEATNY